MPYIHQYLLPQNINVIYDIMRIILEFVMASHLSISFVVVVILCFSEQHLIESYSSYPLTIVTFISED